MKCLRKPADKMQTAFGVNKYNLPAECPRKHARASVHFEIIFPLDSTQTFEGKPASNEDRKCIDVPVRKVIRYLH
jgi:hypothetical protein